MNLSLIWKACTVQHFSFRADITTASGINVSQFHLKWMPRLIEGPTLAFVAVPEPTTWAMMFVGFGSIGLAVRSRSRRMAKVVSA